MINKRNSTKIIFKFFSDVTDEEDIEGPEGRIKGVEESDSDDADHLFR